MPYRTPGAVRHRHRLGRPAPRSSPTRSTTRRTDQAPPLPTDHHRRSRLPTLRTRRREPVLPTRLQPLRARLADLDQQPALRSLGRRVRRPNNRRRHDRPDRPPRRRPHPQRQQLPAQTHHRRGPAQRPTRQPGKLEQPERGPLFEEQNRPTIQRASTTVSQQLTSSYRTRWSSKNRNRTMTSLLYFRAVLRPNLLARRPPK